MYNYYDAITEDVKTALNDYEYDYKGLSRDTLEQRLNDDLFIDDAVTGNGSGSYTFSDVLAEEYINGDPNARTYIDDLTNEFCMPSDVIAEHVFDFEYWDVSIRCYLLPQVIHDVLDALDDSDYFD